MLAEKIHAHLVEHKSTFDTLELAFIFNRPEAEILAALRQLEAEGKAQCDGDDWRMRLVRQREQQELFAIQ